MQTLDETAIAQLREILRAKINYFPPDYRSESYAEMCEPYKYRYYSPRRPVGSWMRPGLNYLLVASTSPSCGYVYTQEPIPVDKLLSLELVPSSTIAWNVLFELVYAHEQH